MGKPRFFCTRKFGSCQPRCGHHSVSDLRYISVSRHSRWAMPPNTEIFNCSARRLCPGRPADKSHMHGRSEANKFDCVRISRAFQNDGYCFKKAVIDFPEAIQRGSVTDSGDQAMTIFFNKISPAKVFCEFLWLIGLLCSDTK